MLRIKTGTIAHANHKSVDSRANTRSDSSITSRTTAAALFTPARVHSGASRKCTVCPAFHIPSYTHRDILGDLLGSIPLCIRALCGDGFLKVLPREYSDKHNRVRYRSPRDGRFTFSWRDTRCGDEMGAIVTVRHPGKGSNQPRRQQSSTATTGH